MPLNLRASEKVQNFNVPVSYRVQDNEGKFLDARNVQSIQGRLDTRYGTSRYNATQIVSTDPAFGSKIESLSFFKKSDGTQYTLAKCGINLFSVGPTGAPVDINAGGFLVGKHRGITWNDRHIFCVEGQGLYSWDGTILSQLGQAAPSTAPTLTAPNAAGSLITTNIYRVAITFVATSIGFESNYKESDLPAITLTAPNLEILVSDLPLTAANGFVDKVNIYLKNVTAESEYLYVGQVDLGATTYLISEESTSASTPPTKNGAPLAGGAKYLTSFNSKLVYAGNATYPNEVYFSEEDLPDAFNDLDTQIVLPMPGQGEVTGLAVGLFNDSVLDPFLVIFKRKSIWIYSEIGGIENAKRVELSREIGCVSHDTIQVKNGNVYFLSEEGWRLIVNGRLATDSQGDAITLGNGAIDDIFKSSGFTYEVNRTGMAGAFSVYYPTLDQYMTWVSEASNNAYTKIYTYEFDVGGFKPWEFELAATCACLGENAEGRDIVLFGTNDGYIIKHSILENRSDIDATNAAVAIDAFAVLPWVPLNGDYDATYNFRELILKGVVSSSALTVKTFVDYNLNLVESGDYSFTDPNSGFILDVSALDEGILSDDRSIVTARSDINRVGENIAIGIYQSIIDANIGLISMQVDSSKNGNRNLSRDNGDDEGGFDTDTGTYYPSVSQSVLDAAASAAAAAASAASVSDTVPSGGAVGDFLERDTLTTTEWKDGSYSGYSARFTEMFSSTGLKDTLDKILMITYAAPTISLSCSPSSAVREKGTTVAAVTMTATTTKFSDDITGVTHFRNGVLVDTEASPIAAGGVETFTESTPFSDTMTFYSKVTDGTTLVQSNTVTYSYVYPYYYGAGAVSLSAANVALLTKYVIASTASMNRSFTTSNGDVYYFAYPASYGALSSILDENGFETISDWTLRTENITGLDASAVSYRIYEFNNPVVAGSTDYTFIR
jgi:hypothetical protein